MEIYAEQTLLDVVVATPLAAEILRGARRAVWNGRPRAIAWGRLPPDDAAIVVHFFPWGFRRRTAPAAEGDSSGRVHAAEVIKVGERFWVAVADGRFDTVTATHHGIRERRKIVTVRP